MENIHEEPTVIEMSQKTKLQEQYDQIQEEIIALDTEEAEINGVSININAQGSLTEVFTDGEVVELSKQEQNRERLDTIQAKKIGLEARAKEIETKLHTL